MPKRRTRRPSRTVPAQRRPPSTTRPAQQPATPAQTPSAPSHPALRVLADSVPDSCAPLTSAAQDSSFQEWLDGTAVVCAIDALLVWVGDGRALDDGVLPDGDGDGTGDLLAVVGVTGPAADEAQRDRARLLVLACLQCSVLETDAEALQIGPSAVLWTSPTSSCGRGCERWWRSR